MNVKVCVPVCGDGILSTPMEECDDMNLQWGTQRQILNPNTKAYATLIEVRRWM